MKKMKKNSWHIVSQICWCICVNFERVRPSAALNATELARRWAIPSRPAAPSTVLSSSRVGERWERGMRREKTLSRSEPRKRCTARAKAPSRWQPERRIWGIWKAGNDSETWRTWNIMKHVVDLSARRSLCYTLSIFVHFPTGKSLWLFGPGAAGVAGLSKAAWSSSRSCPSPDPTQRRRIGCDCHRSCRVNEHKCQHCYGSASAALKIWIKQTTELAHWGFGNYIILNNFMWTVNLNIHYSHVFTLDYMIFLSLRLNHNIDLTGFSASIPTELFDWRKNARRAAVSSFGFSGTNGHAMASILSS